MPGSPGAWHAHALRAPGDRVGAFAAKARRNRETLPDPRTAPQRWHRPRDLRRPRTVPERKPYSRRGSARAAAADRRSTANQRRLRARAPAWLSLPEIERLRSGWGIAPDAP